MDCFEILGIARTDEIKKIKKAYAAKTKEFHPEENPEEFQVLHDAYEEAAAWARRTMREAELPAPDAGPERTDDYSFAACGEGSEWNEAFEKIAGAAEKSSVLWDVRRILEQCRNLYLNEPERVKLYHWKDLLEEPQYAEVLRSKEFVAAWYEFLESHHLFPYRIWLYFSSQDGLRFSGEDCGMRRFPYSVYMEQAQAAEAHRQDPHVYGIGTPKEASPFKAKKEKKRLTPAIKTLLYMAALAGAAAGGGVLGLIAGLILG